MLLVVAVVVDAAGDDAVMIPCLNKRCSMPVIDDERVCMRCDDATDVYNDIVR